MSIIKHLFALGILVSPLAATAADSNVAETNVAESAAGPVQVTFTNPDKFTDAYPHRYGTKERDAVLKALTKHMEKVGGRYLKPGQTLKIEVLDLDLAGRVEWWHPNNYDIRYMRDIDSPAMKVRYTLDENGTVLANGEERLTDMNYLMGLAAISSNSDPLKYEKAMLDDWFRNRFGKNARS